MIKILTFLPKILRVNLYQKLLSIKTGNIQLAVQFQHVYLLMFLLFFIIFMNKTVSHFASCRQTEQGEKLLSCDSHVS